MRLLTITPFKPEFYTHLPWICLALALLPAICVSSLLHRWHLGRLVLAILVSALAGALFGFLVTYAVGSLSMPSSNKAQAGVLPALIMLVASPLASFFAARSFPASRN